MKKKAIYLLILCFNYIHSQTDISNILLGIEEKTDMSVTVFDSLVIKKDYENLESVKNDTPENLMKSILSANSQEWFDYNILGGSLKSSKKKEEYFNKVKNMDKDKNFIKLIHSIDYSINNIPTRILKFYFKQDKMKDVSGCYVLQKINGRWYKTSNPTTSNLSIIIMRIKTNVLIELLTGETSNNKIKEIHKNINSNGFIDINLFEKIFFSWYSPTKNTEMLNLFIDSKAW